MITVLQYLVIAAAIGLVVFLVAVLVFGRGEQMAPLPARTSPAELPDGGIAGPDIRGVRFAVGARGYRMSDVDWTLERLADEVDRLRVEVVSLGGDPDALPERTVLGERGGVGGDSTEAADAAVAGMSVPDRAAPDAAVVPDAGDTSGHGTHPVTAAHDAVDPPSNEVRRVAPDPMVQHRS